MSKGAIPVCITCGQAAGGTPQLNRLPNGQVCPACRDRLLATLPPALPSRESKATPTFGAGISEFGGFEPADDRDRGDDGWQPPSSRDSG